MRKKRRTCTDHIALLRSKARFETDIISPQHRDMRDGRPGKDPLLRRTSYGQVEALFELVNSHTLFFGTPA